MKRYLKLAFYYLKVRLVARLRKRFLIKVLQQEDSQLLSDLDQVGLPVKSWIQGIRKKPSLYASPAKGVLDVLKDRLPQHIEGTIKDAERVLAHEFDMLGSGPFTPIDPDRNEWDNGYQPIDWYLDPVSGLRFPQGILYTDWELFKMRPGLADIKLPWELARCQHWPLLGQAFKLSHDETYAKEIAHQLDDFMESNPIGVGINWVCTMDVALRALNWALALELIRESKSLDDHFWVRAYDALYSYGQFIRHNLENVSEVTSNHFLSNIVGLFYVATVFQAMPKGQEWLSFSRDSLEEEMTNQVLDDGADFESSIPYHRLATELFLGAAHVADISGAPLSDSYKQRLSAMMDYMLGVLRPDGLMPQCGDADDGRLHIFTYYYDWQPQDPRHLFASAALILGRHEFLNYAGNDGLWEAAWWGFDIAGLDVAADPPPPVSRLFPDAGHAVFRDGGTYLLVTNSVVGTKGFGNHKHNDQLAFEFHALGVPLLVDAGSHVYTSDPDSRNLFRGTGYHNTLKIDGTEQNETNPEWFFRMFDSGTPEHLDFSDEGNVLLYRGRHIGYQRLKNRVVHERSFQLLKEEGALFITDKLRGKGHHLLEWHFHCAPGVEINSKDGGTVWITHQGKSYGLVSVDQTPANPSEGWCSPAYGKRELCPVIDYRCEAEIFTSASPTTWSFILAPADWLSSPAGIDSVRGFEVDISQIS